MYKDISAQELNISKSNWLLIVTATPIETEYLHKELQPWENHESILRIHHDIYTYYIGVFGSYLTIHVQCGNMGSISRSGSIMTVNEAIAMFRPKITLMVGVAFGVNEKEQNIGDVLVSECISPYNLKKVQDGKDIIRNNDAPASSLLIDRFRNARSWEHLVENNSKSKMFIAPILSGEELINDIKRRNNLLEEKPTAKGGEMEGAGVYAAADRKSEWIIVKGICDFADGNKDDNKDNKQIQAIQSALSLCKEVFLSQTAFENLDLHPIQKTQNSNYSKPEMLLINKILFDRYDSTKENYYVNRIVDDTFSSNLYMYSVWIYGKSGRGKSNVILRDIIDKKANHIFISLANCIGLSVDDFFKEIFIELSEKLEPEIECKKSESFQVLIKNIVSLLEKHFNSKEVYIIIDEIPLGDESVYKDFTEKICSLFISNLMYSSCTQIKYILSSINTPLPHIKDFNQKIHEVIKFIKLEDWEKSDCLRLIELIEKELNLNLTKEIRENIISSSNGSPRFIKKVFRNSFALGGLNLKNHIDIIEETKRELNQY